MIPKILRDNTTIIKNHTLKTYIFCVLLRIAIGLLVITDKLPAKLITFASNKRTRERFEKVLQNETKRVFYG